MVGVFFIFIYRKMLNNSRKSVGTLQFYSSLNLQVAQGKEKLNVLCSLSLLPMKMSSVCFSTVVSGDSE